MRDWQEALASAIEEAQAELAEVSIEEVQVATAIKWAARACAAADLGLIKDAHEYAHEAIEHAALTGDDDLLAAIRSELGVWGVEF